MVDTQLVRQVGPRMSSKKRRGFQITSVTSSDYSQSAPSSRGSSSQPSTPSLLRKANSHDASSSPSLLRKANSQDASSSRFRVIRLAAGRGQPYRRGRWTCMDFQEREEKAGLRRLMDSMRHAHSLESLDAIGQSDREVGGGPGRGAGEHHHVHSHGPSHLLVDQPIRREVPSAPPAHQERVQPIRVQPIRVQHLDSTPPLQLDVDSAGRSVLRLSPGVSQQQQFTLPEDSDAGSSMVAIDNKIEQAMDLVKCHLQSAVREEVEMLREQIKELQERNDELERENYILRCLH